MLQAAYCVAPARASYRDGPPLRLRSPRLTRPLCGGSDRRDLPGAYPSSDPIPRRPVLAAAQPVRLAVLHELLALRVPPQGPPQPVADVAELAHLGAAGADLHVGHRPPPRPDAVEPVLPVIVAHRRQVEIALTQGLLEDRRGRGLDAAAVHVDAPVSVLERAAARAAVEHLHAIRVHEAQPRRPPLRRDDLRRAAVVHVEGPLRDVEVVRPHVGQAAAGVLAEVAPAREVPVNAERAQLVVELARRRRAVPPLPVHTVRRPLDGQVAGPGRAADADADRAHAADAAAAHVLDGPAEIAVELDALLAAGLEDDVVVARRPHH